MTACKIEATYWVACERKCDSRSNVSIVGKKCRNVSHNVNKISNVSKQFEAVKKHMADLTLVSTSLSHIRKWSAINM